MAVELNHTIVNTTDKQRAADFWAEMLGLQPPTAFGPFLEVAVANGVTLDFADSDSAISPGHYAFLLTEAEFDEAFGRIKERQVAHWADPGRSRPSEINHNDGGRGVYFVDPDGHFLEILTRPYSKD